MDWWTLLATSVALLCVIFFIDGNAVLQLQLFFHNLSKATCHLYLALLPLRRATIHFGSCVRHLFRHYKQSLTPYCDSADSQQRSCSQGHPQDQSLTKEGAFHFLEGVCVVCETVPNLTGAAISMVTAVCHILQGGFYILAAMVRSIQTALFSQMNGEKEKWDKERLKAKEREKDELKRAGVQHGVLSGPCQCFTNHGRRAT